MSQKLWSYLNSFILKDGKRTLRLARDQVENFFSNFWKGHAEVFDAQVDTFPFIDNSRLIEGQVLVQMRAVPLTTLFSTWIHKRIAVFSNNLMLLWILWQNWSKDVWPQCRQQAVCLNLLELFSFAVMVAFGKKSVQPKLAIRYSCGDVYGSQGIGQVRMVGPRVKNLQPGLRFGNLQRDRFGILWQSLGCQEIGCFPCMMWMLMVKLIWTRSRIVCPLQRWWVCMHQTEVG